MQSVIRWLTVLASLGFGACTGDVQHVVGDAAVLADRGVHDQGPRERTLIDAPSRPGDPCPWGECGGNNICVAGMCRAMCEQPMPGCNDVAPECAADEVCLEATSFTDACFFASADTGEECGSGTNCLATNSCVKASQTAPPRCYKLCKYGCTGGQCVQTSNGCEICLK